MTKLKTSEITKSGTRNILVLTNNFPHENFKSGIFKEFVDSIAKYFNKVFVICPTPYMPAFISRFQFIPRAFRKAVNPVDYSYNNISVYFPKFFMLPVDFSRKKAGERAYNATLKLISKETINFDIIHAHFIHYSGEVGARLKEKYRKPLVITGHGYDVYELPFRDNDFRKIAKYALDSADHIITVSNSNQSKLMKLGIEKEKITVIPNGYDPNIFKPIPKEQCVKKLNLPEDKKIIISVGALEEIKGHEYLIKAMSKVVNKKPNVLCFIIGDGSLKTKLQNLISRLNLNNYVKMIGAKPHEEIPLWMNACDLFVLPSLNEGNPTVMFECLGCGKFFVGTSVGGVPEIIINDKLGYLCEPKNPDKLAENILMALDRKHDEEYILDYAKKFSLDKITKETFKIYEKVMKNGKGK